MERGGGGDPPSWDEPPGRGVPRSDEPGTGERSQPDTGTGETRPAEPGTGERGYEDPGTGARRWEDLPTEEWQQRWEQMPESERERRWGEVSEDRRERQQQGAVRRGKRHRDLPAAVRRRQAIAVIVIVGLVLVGGWKLLGGGGGDSDKAGEKPIPVRKLVGQTVVGKTEPSGPNKQLLKRVRKGQVGGVIVGATSQQQLSGFVKPLAKAAAAGHNPPLLIMIDQEGGPVKRVPGPPDVSPAELGKTGDAAASEAQGQQTGAFLKKAGVNVDLAPVADVAHSATPKTLSTRTFGSDPVKVGELSTAFAKGLKTGGVAATVKHFPGLGFTDTNPDFAPATVGAAIGDVQADMKPFEDAIDAGVPMVMMSTAVYPALGSQLPATMATNIVQGQLREKLGFKGVVITDDLEGASATNGGSSSDAAVRSIQAGCDMVLFAKTGGASASAYKSMLRLAQKGKLSRDTLETAYNRILALKKQFASG